MMLRNASFLGLILFLITLSCRSDARNLETGSEHTNVEAIIGHGSLNDPTESADVTLSIEEGNKTAEETASSTKSESKVGIEEERHSASDRVVDVVPAKVDQPIVAPIQEAISDKTPIEKTIENKPTEVELSTVVGNSTSLNTETSSVEEKDEEISIVEESQINSKEPASIVTNIHDAWDALLKKYVSASGFVDYKGLKADASKVDAYLLALSSKQPKDSDISKDAMAYYINVYNAATVKLILDNYPLASIKEINGGKPWDKVWIELGGQKYSLNNIEHDILRPRFKDERVHFAVNCASASCPKIANRAFSGSDLEVLLEKLTREFVNDGKLNSLDPNTPQLSKLFQWYQGDFDNVIDFVNKYSEVKVSASAKITYKDYLWNLNGK